MKRTKGDAEGKADGDLVGWIETEGDADGDALILGCDDGWVVIVGLMLGLLEGEKLGSLLVEGDMVSGIMGTIATPLIALLSLCFFG